ncbi:major facilitator superfamily domain-containing protein [Trichoderma breve]|uniref:Major facilitator superfamily domain-containing protein n=1 Tax=Trichoderma breve TaxID=2034170 RepID=A0A9W9EFA6_9HYPO|nr:major facilitator superfamily domain-containing protein [Trichoderma breve]KAJ4865625.1 major facilitator superfamily domain-containing protein [Trichoderma breve]
MTVNTASSTGSETLAEPKEVYEPEIEPNTKPIVPSDNDDMADIEAATNTKPNQLSTFKWILVCFCVYISDFVYGLDTTIAADIQGAVTQTFGTVDQLAWLGGALFNSFNQKWLYVAGVVLFEVGSALCGAAPSMSALIVGRVLAGAGGTGIYLGTLNFFSSELVSPERRGAYISGISIVWGLGAVLGPAIGGAFSISKATWRWGFYINLVLGALAAPIWIFLLPSVHPTKGVSIKDRLLRLDFVGFILSAAAWSIFTVVFIAGGNYWAWKDGRTIASLYFCILTTPSTRSFPGHLLRYKVHILLGASTACAISSLYVAIYYIPVYFQFVESDSPLKAAVRILPLVLVAVAVSFSSGSTLFYVYIDPSVSAGVIYGVSVVMALGIGLTWQTGYTVATLKFLPQDIGNALSIQNLSQIGGSTIVLVIAGQVFQTGAQSVVLSQLEGELRDRALLAITDAIKTTFIPVITAGALIFVAGLSMKMEKLF